MSVPGDGYSINSCLSIILIKQKWLEY